ncbi:DALR anticodon-binding domain-containing protein [Marinicrinis lubricantis]|uniref:DALR anticodon-binding domain-containing protein n=1 Tax=Marinicrinis lubricantis TaxID=2086470 RepID=UPI0039EE67FE
MIERMESVIEQARSEHAGMSSKELATAAIRYYLLRFHLHTEVVFDLQQATEITGNTGVYVMYAHARAVSILNKARELGIQPSTIPNMPELKMEEVALLRHLSAWQETLYSASRQLAPHILCGYAYELAGLFNNFYANCPILKADDQHRTFRVWLTSKFQAILGDALHVLGLPAPERM